MQANFKKTPWQPCSRILNLVNKVLPTFDYSIFAIDYDLHYNRHQLQNTTNHVSKYTSCIHHHQFGPSSHAKRLLMPLQALTSWQSWYRWITTSRRPRLQIQSKARSKTSIVIPGSQDIQSKTKRRGPCTLQQPSSGTCVQRWAVLTLCSGQVPPGRCSSPPT